MHQKTQLLLALARGMWALNLATATELAPLADRVLAGEGLELLQAHYKASAPEVQRQLQLASPYAATTGTPRAFRMGWFTDLDLVPEGSVAIIGVQGIILKYGMCGIGSMDRAQRVIEAANHPNVAAILLDIDTPGGQVAGLSTLYDAIVEARKIKPVLGLINDGDCYSAGYNTASPCTEIWATHGTCGVGSIGTMCQFTDTQEADKKAGIKRVAVYATASTEKNAKYHKALAGDTTELVKELDLLNNDFQQKILAYRDDKISDQAKVFKGQTYSAAEGVQLGLVDTIGTMQQALARCVELAREKPAAAGNAPVPVATETTPTNPNSSNQPPQMKQYALIAAALGVAAKDLVVTPEGSHLATAGLDAIEASLVQAAANATTLASVQNELATAQGELTTANTTLATAQGTVTAQAGELTTLKAQLAKAPAGTAAALPAGTQETPPADAGKKANAWDDLDKQMADYIKQQNAEFNA